MALTDKLTAIGNAIREKNGTTDLIPLVDMPQAILDIVNGGGDVIIGADYTNIVYNEDDTITLTDKDGIEHTMECEYTDGKLTSVRYDDKAIELTYDGDVLVKVGKTAVDVSNVPKELKTTVKADSSASNLVLVDVSSEVVVTSREITTNSSVALAEE